MPQRTGMPAELEKLKGTVIAGRYVVEQCVGVGGMAVVFRGRHASLDRAVAIKVLRPEYREHGEVVARFDREARAASHFDHPNCIQVFDCGLTRDGFKFMVMPFLKGRELAKVLAKPLPASQASALAIQILRGLEYAHRRGVVHRDLKPDNIFVVRDHEGHETLKVVDFGIAKILDDTHKVDDVRTKVGAIVGTPAYMSPEQAMGAEVDLRADLYSVGVILYRMLAGKLPFVAADARGLLYQHVAEKPRPLPEGVPKELATVVMRLLAKDPEKRFPTASAAIAALSMVNKQLRDDPSPWIHLLDQPEPRRKKLQSPKRERPPKAAPAPAPAPANGGNEPISPVRTGKTELSIPAVVDPKPDPQAMPRPDLSTDPGATPPPASTKPPSERSGASVLSTGEKQALRSDSAPQELEKMGQVLDDIITGDLDAPDAALRSGIYEAPPGGWTHHAINDDDDGLISESAPKEVEEAATSDRETGPVKAAQKNKKAVPTTPAPAENDPASNVQSLTPHFSDTGFNLQDELAKKGVAALAKSTAKAPKSGENESGS